MLARFFDLCIMLPVSYFPIEYKVATNACTFVAMICSFQ